jgi:hypothetical protein
MEIEACGLGKYLHIELEIAKYNYTGNKSLNAIPNGSGQIRWVPIKSSTYVLEAPDSNLHLRKFGPTENYYSSWS